MNMKMAMMQALMMGEMSNSIMSREGIASGGYGGNDKSMPRKQPRSKSSKKKNKIKKNSRKKNR